MNESIARHRRCIVADYIKNRELTAISSNFIYILIIVRFIIVSIGLPSSRKVRLIN